MAEPTKSDVYDIYLKTFIFSRSGESFRGRDLADGGHAGLGRMLAEHYTGRELVAAALGVSDGSNISNRVLARAELQEVIEAALAGG